VTCAEYIDLYGISCFSVVFFQKKINKNFDLLPKIIFVVSKMHQSSFVMLQKQAGTKIGDQKNKKT